MLSETSKLWAWFPSRLESARLTFDEFSLRFEKYLSTCRWEPHPLYSVFTQYDQDYYLNNKDAFAHKYRCFYAVSKTILPKSIIELGTCAGSSADAYLGAAPGAKYIGIDLFGEAFRLDDKSSWKPYDIAIQLLRDRGFTNWQLMRSDLRRMHRLSSQADLVVVDAAHDFDNEYADLRLALTAKPKFIFVDDADDENAAKPAIEKFLQEDLQNRVKYTFPIPYVGGGLVIRLKV